MFFIGTSIQVYLYVIMIVCLAFWFFFGVFSEILYLFTSQIKLYYYAGIASAIFEIVAFYLLIIFLIISMIDITYYSFKSDISKINLIIGLIASLIVLVALSWFILVDAKTLTLKVRERFGKETKIIKDYFQHIEGESGSTWYMPSQIMLKSNKEKYVIFRGMYKETLQEPIPKKGEFSKYKYEFTVTTHSNYCFRINPVKTDE